MDETHYVIIVKLHKFEKTLYVNFKKHIYYQTARVGKLKGHVCSCSILFNCSCYKSFHQPQMLWRYVDISTWSRVHFEYIFWFLNHLVIKICQVIDVVMGNTFRTEFSKLEDYVLTPDPINQKSVMTIMTS